MSVKGVNGTLPTLQPLDTQTTNTNAGTAGVFDGSSFTPATSTQASTSSGGGGGSSQDNKDRSDFMFMEALLRKAINDLREQAKQNDEQGDGQT